MSVMLSAASSQFGRYELLSYLGSGGMSDVFVALHTGLRKRVALKLLRPYLRKDPAAVERFLREGECAARVSHPNVVHVTDVGTEQGVPFLVMELLEGRTLEQHVEESGPLGLQAAVDLLLPLIDGVQAVHDAGVLHRDIKPGNVLLARLPDGSIVPKLVDFGIATLTERRNITGGIGPIGTPNYMSPEQAAGRELDFRSDLYSLASTLFEIVTNESPFGEGEIKDVIERVVKGEFPRASDRHPGLPLALDDILLHATAFDPTERYQTVRELGQALAPFASPRVRKLYAARAGAAAPASFLPSRLGDDDDPQLTERIDLMPPRNSRPTELPQRSPMLVLGLLGFTLAAAIAVLAMRLDHTRDFTPLTAAQTIAAPAAHESQSKPPLAPHTRRLVVLSPAAATAELDGQPLGHGFVELPSFNDGEMHELRVSAPGHVTRVLLFRKNLPVARIALEPVEARGATREYKATR